MASSKLPKLINLEMSDFLLAALGDEVPQYEHEMVLGFVEVLEDGVKFSMSFQEKQKGFCVAVTLPPTGSEEEKVCATFWGGTLHSALSKAWACTFMFGGHRDGWKLAEARMDTAQRDAANTFAEYHRSRKK